MHAFARRSIRRHARAVPRYSEVEHAIRFQPGTEIVIRTEGRHHTDKRLLHSAPDQRQSNLLPMGTDPLHHLRTEGSPQWEAMHFAISSGQLNRHQLVTVSLDSLQLR